MTRTVTETVVVYEFAELSERAKDRVRQEHASDHYWGLEYLDTLPAAAGAFGLEVKNYAVDFADTTFSSIWLTVARALSESEVAAVVAELRNTTYPWNGDGDAEAYRDGIVAAWEGGERDPVGLVEAGFDTWLAYVQGEYEGYCSDDVIAELHEDVYFRADGSYYGRIEDQEVAHG